MNVQVAGTPRFRRQRESGAGALYHPAAFLGLGKGLGSALLNGVAEIRELSHYRTARHGEIRQAEVAALCKAMWRLVAAIEPDDVAIGGGNVKRLMELPPH